MKISGVGSGAPAKGARRADKTDGTTNAGSFKNVLAESSVDGVDNAPPVGAAAAMGAVDVLLAIQSMDDATEREARKRLVKRGEDLLDQLEEVRHGLLLGTLSKDKLERLSQSVRTQRREACADPGLAALLDEIELRAEVELAKLSR